MDTSEKIRSKRSVDNLITAIDAYIADDGPISKETFLKHLSYSCNACNGNRDLLERDPTYTLKKIILSMDLIIKS